MPRRRRSAGRGESYFYSNRRLPPTYQSYGVAPSAETLARNYGHVYRDWFGEAAKDYPEGYFEPGYGTESRNSVLAQAPQELSERPIRRPLKSAFAALEIARMLKSARYPRREAMRLLYLNAPSRVLFCLRRKIRKAVLHAFGVAGRRGIGRGGVNRTANSMWRC